MSPKTPTQAEADCITAQTWIASVSTDDREFGRRESDALDAGALAYRVIDHFGKSGANRSQREQALAGAILSHAQRLYAHARESMQRELDFAKQCERERCDKVIAEMRAAMHAAVDAVVNRP
jgi:hypothetical protein